MADHPEKKLAVYVEELVCFLCNRLLVSDREVYECHPNPNCPGPVTYLCELCNKDPPEWMADYVKFPTTDVPTFLTFSECIARALVHPEWIEPGTGKLAEEDVQTLTNSVRAAYGLPVN